MKTLRDLATILFRVDPPPSARLSYVLGVRQRQTQYWLSGQHIAPKDVIQIVEHQIQAVREFGLDVKVAALVREAKEAGISPHVVAHYLDQTVEDLKVRDNNP
ncbi:hypothetical protein [Microvirga sp. G4-2]|uniref:hypothetical protein n=1 Tax=Microvirga sp. G4-2 TaxID=3434467 RepID=UPI0040445056